MQAVILDTLIDTVKLIPFLFVTYLLMEYMEHKAQGRFLQMLRTNGAAGPALGAVIGVFPQCGFSASAANLYAGRILNPGTLVAVFLSTSDEMLPILLSRKAEFSVIGGILFTKVIVAAVAGTCVNLLWKLLKRDIGNADIHGMCEKEHCHCEEGILKSVFRHTGSITGFIFLFSLCLNFLIYRIGEETIAGWMNGAPVLGPLITAFIGLIPNCAASILITELYLDGLLGAGSMLAGLLAGCGVGLAVLFKVNRHIRENLGILAFLYAVGAGVGIFVELVF